MHLQIGPGEGVCWNMLAVVLLAPIVDKSPALQNLGLSANKKLKACPDHMVRIPNPGRIPVDLR